MGDYVAGLVNQLRHAPGQLVHALWAVMGRRSVDRVAAQFHNLTVRQDRLYAFDMLSRGAVLQPAASRGIKRHHAAHRGNGAVGRIRAKALSRRGKIAIQLC